MIKDIKAPANVLEPVHDFITHWVYRRTKVPVDYYQNMSTMKISTNIDDVITKDVPPVIVERKSRKIFSYYEVRIVEIKKKEYLSINCYTVYFDKQTEQPYRKTYLECAVLIDRDHNFYKSLKEYSNNDNCDWWASRYATQNFKIADEASEAFYQFTRNGILLDPDIFKSSCKEFFGEVCFLSGNKVIAWDDFTDIFQYAKYKKHETKVNKKKGPRQLLLDKILSVELPNDDLSDVDVSIKNIATLANMNHNDVHYCVFRTYKRLSEFKTIEAGRLYVSKKDVIACKKNENNEYVILSNWKANVADWRYYLHNFDVSYTKGTKLEYFGEMLTKIDPSLQSIALWGFLSCPLIEQFAKLDDNSFKGVLKILEFVDTYKYKSKPAPAISYIFGSINTNEKKLQNMFGVSLYQLKKLLASLTEFNYMPYALISTIKRMVYDSGVAMSDLDTQSFDKILDFVVYAHNDIKSWPVFHTREDFFTAIQKTYNLKYAINSIEYIKNFNKIMHSEDLQFYQIACYYMDYISMVGQLEMQSRLKARFDTLEHLIDAHNTLKTIIDSKKYEIEQKNWEKASQNWSQYCYAPENSEFIVIAPSHPVDIAEEGIILCHCVKSYIPKVTSGSTNILFIRKKNTPKVPFFTAEVHNGHLRQVHGLKNCLAKTEPNLTEFIKNWAKDCNIKLSDYNKMY